MTGCYCKVAESFFPAVLSVPYSKETSEDFIFSLNFFFFSEHLTADVRHGGLLGLVMDCTCIILRSAHEKTMNEG